MRPLTRTPARLMAAAALAAAATVACGPAAPEAVSPTRAPPLADTPRPTGSPDTLSSDPVASGSPTTAPDTSTPTPGRVTGHVEETSGPSPTPSTRSPESTSPPAPDRARTLTPADDGTTVHLRIGEVVELHVADSFAPEPDVQGDAIEVAETVSATGSSGREFEVRAVGAGHATLTGESDGTTFSISFQVEA